MSWNNSLFDKKNIETAYPFGFGLSYSDYEYSSLQIPVTAIQKDSIISVSVDIQNTGAVAGEEIVQLYVGFKNSTVDRPVKLLRAFDKVLLQPNEKKSVTMKVAAEDLAWYNPNTKQWEIESMEYELYIGSSSAEKDLLTASFTID